MKPSLEALIATLSKDAFLKEYWQAKKAYFKAGDPSLSRAITELPQVQSLDAVLAAVKGHVMVYGDCVVEESGGITNRVLVPVTKAPSWYEKGATLEFDYVQGQIPQLQFWVEAVRRDLGLPEGTFGKAIIYCSPRGSGLKTHFDAYANFVTQVRGSKTWKIAPNTNVVDPMVHYDLFNYPYIPNELKSYWSGTPPDAELSTGQTVELSAGSFLFLPRGYWHKTEASMSETLSVNITFNQPTWMDLALLEIRRRLVQLPQWRELADGAGSPDPRTRELALSRATSVASSLLRDLGAIRGDDIFSRQSENVDIYQSAALLHKQLQREYLF